MDRRFLTVLVVSLLFALVVSAVFYLMAGRGPKSRKAEASDTREIVVAGRALSAGWMLKATDLRMVKYPVAQIPKGAFSKLEDAVDRSVLSSIPADEPVIEARVTPRGGGVGLSPIIPVGMRAVTVRVNDVVGVAGFVLPGMRVDVLITGEPPGGNGRMTKTVLQNMLVLSAGQTMQVDATGKPVNAPNVTLQVTPEQAETLTLSGNEGKIQLVLRNAGDQTITETGGLSLSKLYGVKELEGENGGRRNPEDLSDQQPARVRRPAKPAAPAVPPGPPPESVVLIRGTEKKTEQLPAMAAETPGERNP